MAWSKSKFFLSILACKLLTASCQQVWTSRMATSQVQYNTVAVGNRFPPAPGLCGHWIDLTVGSLIRSCRVLRMLGGGICRDVISWTFSEFGGNSEINFLGRIKLGAAGTEVGSLKANNEKIGSLRSGRYCSKVGGNIVEFVVWISARLTLEKLFCEYVIMWATTPSIDLFGYVIWLSLSWMVANSVRHRSHRKWPQCQNATAVSQVTPLVESIEMVQ